MRALKILTGVLLIIILFTGCLRVNTEINLNPDGSGTIEETVFIKGEVLDMIRQFTSAFDENEEKNEFKFYSEEEQKNKANNYGEGVAFVRGEEIFESNWEGYKVIYSFADINKLKIDPSPDNKVNLGDETENVEPEVREYITFNFSKSNTSNLKINIPRMDFDENEESETIETTESDSASTEMTEMFKNMFDGMKMSVFLTLNGKVEQTNATYVHDNNITLVEVDFTNILKNDEVVKVLEGKKPQSMEEFRELTKDIEGIRIEFQEQVDVKFH